MAATRDKYQPLQVSERNFSPFITCSLVSFFTGGLALTMGESVVWPNGKTYGQAALNRLFNKGWSAVKQPGDKGYGRSDFNKFMSAMGYPVTLDEVKFTRDEEDITTALKKGHLITMAGNVKGCRGLSPLRQDVNEVDHRMAFKGLRKRNGNYQTRKYDPMTPLNSKRWGQWVPLNDVFDFGARFRHWGKYLAERFVTGHYTREAKARRNAAKSLVNIQQRVVDLQENLQATNDTVGALEQTISNLKAQLKAAQDSTIDRASVLLDINEANEALERIKASVTVSPTR